MDVIRVREFSVGDLHSLVPLYRDFYNLHREFLGNPNPLSDEVALEIVQESVGRSGDNLIIAEECETGRIVGFACWEEREGAFFGREVFVLPEFRGKGIGSQLLASVEIQVREAGADAFFISVIPHNQHMLEFAYQRGYDTLNTIELRKELAEKQPRRGEVTLFGLHLKVI
jgi:GNAT superfamily N-acetyltransferase